MKKIRLRVTLFPGTVGGNTLRTKAMRGEFEITIDEDDGRVEIRDEDEPHVTRDRSAMLGTLVKLEVEAKP